MITENNNKIKIVVAPIEKQTGDVVLNWATNLFTTGPDSFYKLISYAGVQPLDAIHTFKANISKGGFKEGDCLSTIAGLLKFRLIIHSLLPTTRDYNLNWSNIFHTIKAYKEDNICRSIIIPMPDWADRIEVISSFKNYDEMFSNMEYVFIVQDEREKNLLESTFNSMYDFKKDTFMNKVDDFFKKIVARISPQSPTALIWVNGNNKKKLQENSKGT